MANLRAELASRRKGDKRNERSLTHPKASGGFSLSRDIREDRGQRQVKLGRRKGSRNGV